MRKGQKTVIIDMLKKGNIFWLFRQAAKLPLLHISKYLPSGHSLGGPIMATIVPTSKCNLDCKFCDIEGRKGGENLSAGREFTTEGLVNVVDQLKEIGVSGIGFSGGEPVLHRGTIPAIDYARKKGLSVTLATNAASLNDRQIEEIVNANPNNITISIDSSSPSIHDKLRNKVNAYKETIAAIKKLKHQIELSKNSSTKIIVVCVICDENVHEIRDIIEQAKNIHADAIGFIPEHYIKNGLLTPKKSNKCVSVSDKILDLGKGFLENSDWYIRSLDQIFRDGTGPNKPCSQGFTSITIGPRGQLYACWPDYLNNKPFSMLDLNKDTLKGIWNSEVYRKKRIETLKCHRCFINCIAELNHLVRFW